MSKRLILLLVLCVHLATSAAILAKRLTAAEKEAFAKKVNEYRVSEARSKEIGNMHEVKYDYELEKVANSMTGNCNFPKGNYLLVPAEELKRFAEQASSQELKVQVSRAIVNALFHPLQTKMACAELPTSCSTPGIEGGFCLFGPQNSALTPDDLKKGPLGTHCDHGTADNGLCKADSKTVGFYEEGKEGSGAEKTTPGNVEDKRAETKAATNFNSMILAVVFAIVMIFQ